ncbi:MAG: hypothetical protein JSU63_01625 [Phycisphaerales bacterium]|nr:MAG: hypothetical protein JSU63_01625 [Phycisphaerales bacterium]
MKSVVLFEDEGHSNLAPLVYWRSVFELKVGRKILLDRTAQCLGTPITGVWTRNWLAAVAAQRCGAPANQPVDDGTILVNGRWLTGKTPEFPAGPCVGVADGQVAFIVCNSKLASDIGPTDLLDTTRRDMTIAGIEQVEAGGSFVNYPWDIISNLDELLVEDWRPTEAGAESEVDSAVKLEPADQIHIGQSTFIHPTAVIDASPGPVYISHDVRVGPYAVLEGPLYIGPGSQINPHTWLHGGNSIGPVCKVGGELDCCVLHSFTNKQHDGFLGHAYVGSWVNIGAGCVNSNLKNTYGKIRVPINRRDVDSKLQLFGCIIADHAKIGINATIPTGAVIGMSATVATSDMIPKFLPSFAWFTGSGVGLGDPGRLLDAATQMMIRRNIDMTDEEIELFLELPARIQASEANR